MKIVLVTSRPKHLTYVPGPVERLWVVCKRPLLTLMLPESQLFLLAFLSLDAMLHAPTQDRPAYQPCCTSTARIGMHLINSKTQDVDVPDMGQLFVAHVL